jgi:V-type H+-transporting ATPase subunit a
LHAVVPTDRAALVERMVFRVSRGNAIVRLHEIPEPMADPLTPGARVRKSVMTLLYVGRVLGARLRKVLLYFGATEYEVSGSAHALRNQMARLSQEIRDIRQLVSIADQQTRTQLYALLLDTNTGQSPFINLQHALRVEKSVCDSLKRCELERIGSSMLQCEAWIPAGEESSLRAALSAGVAGTGTQVAPVVEFFPASIAQKQFGSPPTYFPTTKFSAPYQGIVDTYGVPRYKEVNPGLFTLISFPFLFGVMYGDVGHGTLLTLAALYFIINENYYNDLVRKKQMDEILGMVFGGRYMLILMGAFAVYAGFIYNDCFSIPLNLFGSRFIFSPLNGVGQPDESQNHYPFGVDPGWYHTSNELAFFNSLKMKLAVTLGVTHMSFGICLSLANHLYFNNINAVYFEFIPRILFMLCTFGYMIFIILLKLCTDWSTSSVPPPNLVQTMISMFLEPGHVDADKQLYNGQAVVQAFLLLVALGSVPVMLFGQPLMARSQFRKLFPELATEGSEGKHSPIEGTHRTHGTRRAHGTRFQAVSSEADESGPSDTEEQKSYENRATLQSQADPKPAAQAAPATNGDAHGADPTSPHYSFSDHLITNSIHTIEFVLGAVSNTASYLRLWALSLAHAELSAVFWDKMIMQYGLDTGSPIMSVHTQSYIYIGEREKYILTLFIYLPRCSIHSVSLNSRLVVYILFLSLRLVIGMAAWSAATFAVLLAMDVLECFLHGQSSTHRFSLLLHPDSIS